MIYIYILLTSVLDVDNPSLHVPVGAVDAASIAGYRQMRQLVTVSNDEKEGRLLTNITPGSLWYASGYNGYCDGTFKSDTCHREVGNDCLLSGHNDGRSGILGDEYSGWLVMTLKDVKEGIIVVKFHVWKNILIYNSNNPRTVGMDKGDGRYLRTNEVENEQPLNYESDLSFGQERQLKIAPDDAIPETFLFDFAINGKVTTWNKEQFLEKRKQLQRVVELFSLMDDENWKGGDVEVAIRVRGVKRVQQLDLTHVYWA